MGNTAKMRFVGLLLTVVLIAPQDNQAFGQELKGGRFSSGKSAKRASSSGIKRNKTDVFPLDREYRLGGFSAAIGMTYMYPGKEGSGELMRNDTNFTFSANAKGKIGLYLEAGWFHSFINPMPFHYIDFGLSYKQFRGTEEVTAETLDGDGNVIASAATENTFNDKFLSAHFNATHHYHFSRYGFVNNSIGINADYNIGNDRTSTTLIPGREENFPEDLYVQLHYKLGIGWKAAPQLLVIPSIETPILTLYPYDDLKSTLPYFSSRYRPFIISIRFLFLRKDLENCNVPNYKGPTNFE